MLLGSGEVGAGAGAGAAEVRVEGDRAGLHPARGTGVAWLGSRSWEEENRELEGKGCAWMGGGNAHPRGSVVLIA